MPIPPKLREFITRTSISYRFPVVAFLLSRFVLFFSLFLAFRYKIIPGFLWTNWDGQHYLDAAQSGYTFGGVGGNGNTIAFFPLYPILMGSLHWLTHLPYIESGVIVSGVFGLLAAAALYKYITLFHSPAAAQAAVLLFCFNPMSIFLSGLYAETTLIFFILLSLILLEKQKWYKAAFAIGLACASKSVGVFLFPILLWYLFRAKKGIWYSLGVLLLASYPLILFMLYQYGLFGTPFAFLRSEAIGWHRVFAWPWTGLEFMWNWGITRNDIHWQTELVFFGTAILTLILAHNSIPKKILYFGGTLLAVSICANYPMSVARYMLCFLPTYFFWGPYLGKRSVLLQVVILIFSGWMVVNGAAFFLYRDIY
jgi:Gpi18-like mannosyltransferase